MQDQHQSGLTGLETESSIKNLMQKKGQEQDKKAKRRGEYLFFREKPI
ncbi:MAG: hypothetical protein OXR72_03480 [Gemmatimonadota bacterium]|nr:hypothetical protein [Gemmatimonadota bacterium]